MKGLQLLGLSAMMSALLIFAASEADAQRRGGGGRGGGGGHQVRSSSSGSIGGAANRSANVNRGGNVNRSGNRVNTGNINTGDINIDVDRGWGGVDHPVAAATAVAATRAFVIGSYYASLPGSCMKVIENGVSYYNCSGNWYQPMYSGSSVQYVAVVAP